MLSSSLRKQNFSVDMRPFLTGGAHGDNKSHSSGIVALDLSDKLRQICYQRSAKIWFVWRIAVDLSWAAGKKWQSSNVVIPTLGLMCLYSSLPTLFQTGIFSPITIHKAQSRINASCCKSRKWQNPLLGSLGFMFKGLGASMRIDEKHVQRKIRVLTKLLDCWTAVRTHLASLQGPWCHLWVCSDAAEAEIVTVALVVVLVADVLIVVL